jgi:hypothetical protein
MQPLSEYWDAYRIGGTDSSAPDSPIDSPLSLRLRPGERPDLSSRNRAFSDALVLDTFRPALTPFHPASSLPAFMDSFGPLMFPLYRAALLRKRVLFMGEAPVQAACNYGTFPDTPYQIFANPRQYTTSLSSLPYQTPSFTFSRPTAPHPSAHAHSSTSASTTSPTYQPSTPPAAYKT